MIFILFRMDASILMSMIIYSMSQFELSTLLAEELVAASDELVVHEHHGDRFVVVLL